MRQVSRRELLKTIAAVPAAAPLLTRGVPAAAADQRSAPAAPATLRVGIVSRHLQWTSLEDAIDLARTAGYDAIEWNVRTGGHVAPEHVERDLPRAIELTRKAGLATPMITTAIQDA